MLYIVLHGSQLVGSVVGGGSSCEERVEKNGYNCAKCSASMNFPSTLLQSDFQSTHYIVCTASRSTVFCEEPAGNVWLRQEMAQHGDADGRGQRESLPPGTFRRSGGQH